MRGILLLMVLVPALALTLRYPFLGVLTWSWFSLMTPHQLAHGAFGLQVNLIIAAVTLISIFTSGAFRHFRFDPLTTLIALFGGWLFVSQTWSVDQANSYKFFDQFLKTLVFIAVCIQLTTDRLKFHALVWILVVGIGYFALKGAAFTIVELGQNRVQGVPKTILEDNNHLGTAMAVVLPMVAYLITQAARPLVKTALMVLFACFVISIIGTHSRGAFVALAVFGFFFWLKSRRKLLILVTLSIVALPAIALMPEKWGERMTSISEAREDSSFMGRVDAWVINYKLAAEHPLTGVGLRNSYLKDVAASVDRERALRAKAAHSIYFEVLGGTGFVGLAIYLALLGTAFLTTLRLQKLKSDPAVEPWIPAFGYYAQIALTVFCVGGAAVSIEMWDGYCILIALIAAALRISRIPVAARAEDLEKKRRRWRVATRGVPIGRPRAGPASAR
jgi:probable O-glycosylation ligase (exosortase A-associated)